MAAKKGSKAKGGGKSTKRKRSAGLTLAGLAREVRGIKATQRAQGREISKVKHNLVVVNTATKVLANNLLDQWGQPHIQQFENWVPMGGAAGRTRRPKRVGSGRRSVKALGSGR